ncbi:MAG: ABC transporter ATP-binding protein [Deferribacteraceae bacterium]|jgi:oligopeptide/dipeptide ABC transporter ATP-binding protein|nr:ABC transporter ATP-binding protein [Deferribacteraceae bacterium]
MLSLSNLTVKISAAEDFYVARELSLSIGANEVVGILGESGSGKSLLAKSICGLTTPPIRTIGGSITLDGRTLTTENDFKEVRGKGISMIFQHPTSALNPVMTIGEQLIETILYHKIAADKATAKELAIDLLTDTGIEHPTDRMNAYPHQLSGGMNQRVMIALALATKPKVLIADEPTTALDVIIQAQIIELLAKLSREKGFSTIFITHDLALAEKISDRILVMYAGEIIEELSKGAPAHHPCTTALKNCLPNFENRGATLPTITGIIPQNTSKYDNCCIFHERCQVAQDRCQIEKPTLKDGVKCFY